MSFPARMFIKDEVCENRCFRCPNGHQQERPDTVFRYKTQTIRVTALPKDRHHARVCRVTAPGWGGGPRCGRVFTYKKDYNLEGAGAIVRTCIIDNARAASV